MTPSRTVLYIGNDGDRCDCGSGKPIVTSQGVCEDCCLALQRHVEAWADDVTAEGGHVRPILREDGQR